VCIPAGIAPQEASKINQCISLASHLTPRRDFPFVQRSDDARRGCRHTNRIGEPCLLTAQGPINKNALVSPRNFSSTCRTAHRPKADLVETLKGSIEVRGFYIVMDSRLDLICGLGAWRNHNAPEQLPALQTFAAQFGWKVELLEHGVVFRGRFCFLLGGAVRSLKKVARRLNDVDAPGLFPS
jgi:hypothetical protein